MLEVSFTVHGVPRPQGSKRHLGQGIMVEASPHLAAWREDVASAARKVYDEDLMIGAVYLRALFTFPRPKSHYGTGRNENTLKPRAPKHHAQKPDLSKLVRAIEDALTGVVFRDDSQVCALRSDKVWGQSAKCQIVVSEV